MNKLIIHDLDIIKPQAEYIKMGNRKINISDMTTGKVLIALKEYDDLDGLLKNAEIKEELKKRGEDFNTVVFNKTIDICIKILKEPFKGNNFFAWYKTRYISKKWLMKFHIRQLKAFLETFKDAVFNSLKSGEVVENPKNPTE